MYNLLNIAVWNANGLTHHILELRAFISENNIDIMLISETHFTNKSFVKIQGYTIYTTNHPAGTARGGTAVIIKNNIKHEPLQDYCKAFIQSTAISILSKHGPINIASIYCPPSCKITKEQFKHYFSSLGPTFLVGGDFNAKNQQWGSRLRNPRGKELYDVIKTTNLQHLSTGEPTYWPADINKTPDLIDFCVLKNINKNYFNIKSCFDLSSDHSPILITLKSKIVENLPPPYLHSKKTNWSSFKECCNNSLHLDISLKNRQEIEDALHIFTTTIQQAAWSSTPTAETPKINNSVATSRDSKKMISDKRQLRKIWQTTQHPKDKQKLNKACKELKQALNAQDNKEFEYYVSNLTPTEATNYSLWKASKNLDRTTARIPPIKKSNGLWAKTNIEKAKLFATHLSDVFQPYSPSAQIDDSKIYELLDSPGQMNFPIKPVTCKELEKLIKQQPNKIKSPGYDLITVKILKELPLLGIKYITQIFNAMLKHGYFPAQLKVAQIILIPKPGKPPEEVTSYRPISLLPVLSKIFEKLLLCRLKPIIEANKLIPSHQFGFREQHSTVEQVHRVVKSIRTAFEKKLYCSAVFLDITQAFDKVWHAGLLFKLKKQLPYPYFEILKSYLEDRYFFVKYNSETTELHKIQSGVPQGSVLGPVLYTLFTADLPTNSHTSIATFADDTVILSSHRDHVSASTNLQLHLNQIQEWLETWRMKANPSKSTHVTFTLRKNICPNVMLGAGILPQSDNTKYLGIHLDRRLTWQKHIFTKRKQLGLKLTSLFWLIGRNSKLSIDNKLLIYKTIIKPIWTYGIQIWGSAAKTNINILQRFQSKALRTISNAPYFVTNNTLHNDFFVPTVQEEINKSNERYSHRLSQHPNALAADLLQISSTQRRLRRFPLTQLIVTR